MPVRRDVGSGRSGICGGRRKRIDHKKARQRNSLGALFCCGGCGAQNICKGRVNKRRTHRRAGRRDLPRAALWKNAGSARKNWKIVEYFSQEDSSQNAEKPCLKQLIFPEKVQKVRLLFLLEDTYINKKKRKICNFPLIFTLTGGIINPEILYIYDRIAPFFRQRSWKNLTGAMDSEEKSTGSVRPVQTTSAKVGDGYVFQKRNT